MLIDSKARELWNTKLTFMQKCALLDALPSGLWERGLSDKRWELISEDAARKLKALDWNFMLGGRLGDLSQFYRP